MPRLIAALMRHGDYAQPAETPGAWLPHPLTEAGEVQARDGATRLFAELEAAGLELDPVIETSTLQRAWQTARIVTDEALRKFGRKFELRERDDLTERSVGAAANLTFDQIKAVLRRDPRFGEPPPGWKASPDYRLPFPGAETLLEAGQRVAKRITESMDELRETADRDTIRLFVGHGGAFRFAAVHFGVLDASRAPGLSMYHCSWVWLERDADGIWQHVAGEWKVRHANVVPAD